MKKTFIITAFIITTAVVLISCGSGPRRDTGRIYMPDMAYSRAYETYAQRDSLVFFSDMSNPANWGSKIFYNNQPVTGTIKRGGNAAYSLLNDSAGYIASAAIVNPYPPMDKADSTETSRLYNINCGVCHGAGGQANGPVAGKLGGVRDLTSDLVLKLADGTIFHSITYGKNNMGGYASQLNSKQRWLIVQYVRALQRKAAPAATATTAVAAIPAKADTVKTK